VAIFSSALPYTYITQPNEYIYEWQKWVHVPTFLNSYSIISYTHAVRTISFCPYKNFSPLSLYYACVLYLYVYHTITEWKQLDSFRSNMARKVRFENEGESWVFFVL